MTTTPAKIFLSGEEIAATLNTLGIDPSVERIEQLQSRIDVHALPPGERDAVVRDAVAEANRALDAVPAGGGKLPERHANQRTLIGDLLEYAERFADVNEEPEGGHCREIIRKAIAWHEFGSATIDPDSIIADLSEYVERFAEENGEPNDGACRRLLARAKVHVQVGQPSPCARAAWDGRLPDNTQMSESQKAMTDQQATIGRSVASVAAGIGGMSVILSGEYARTVRHDGYVTRQLQVVATGDDFWVGTKYFDSRSGRPDGETIVGKYFSPAEVDAAIAYGKGELAWVNAVTGDQNTKMPQSPRADTGLPDEIWLGHRRLLAGNAGLGVIYNNLVGLNITGTDYTDYIEFVANEVKFEPFRGGEKLQYRSSGVLITEHVIGAGEPDRVTEVLIAREVAAARQVAADESPSPDL